MENIVFIGAVVVAVVDAVKSLVPEIKGAVTVVLAGLIGGLISLVDLDIGLLENMSFAGGVMAGLASAGTVGVVRRFGTSSDVAPLNSSK